MTAPVLSLDSLLPDPGEEAPERRTYHVDNLLGPYETVDDRRECPTHEANLIGSKVVGNDDEHMPVLDLDFAHHYVPSSTPGHGHLYIDKPMSWNHYQQLLHLLRNLGIIEEGYYNMALRRGQTFVRAPGVTKEDL